MRNSDELNVRFNQFCLQLAQKTSNLNKIRRQCTVVIKLLPLMALLIFGCIYFVKDINQFLSHSAIKGVGIFFCAVLFFVFCRYCQANLRVVIFILLAGFTCALTASVIDLFIRYYYVVLILEVVLVTLLYIHYYFKKILKRELNPIIANLYPDNKISYAINSQVIRHNGFFKPSKEVVGVCNAVKLLYSNSEYIRIEEFFSGKHSGYSFTAVDINTWYEIHRRKGVSKVPLFRGIVVEIITTNSNKDRIILMRNTDTPTGKFSRIKLEDIEFERLYNVYGKDQILARKLLTPKMMENILQMVKSLYPNYDNVFTNKAAQDMRVLDYPESEIAPEMALLENKFYIFISNPDPFEIIDSNIGLFKEINTKAVGRAIERLCSEIDPILKTIKFLKEHNFI